jgi:ABC-type transporter Mla maintaining outer membrane lipid asymmetry permease subunit MlaE
MARVHPAELVPHAGGVPTTLAVSIPLTVLLIFTLNILLAEFGAADISGSGAAIGAVTQLGPLVTVLVVAVPGRRPSAPTSARAPSARRSTRWRCSASTRSTG